ncbi:MAG: hypothetical protein K0V04_03665 [Deltaproteobacteria bacterium]|nr:hypothetical protein [Deltaproteobacteria bacterium]
MPVSAISHHRIMVGTSQQPLRRRMTLDIQGEREFVRVVGLRYRGGQWLAADDCAAADPLPLEVEPLPARLVFPCPPEGLTVTCPKCTSEVAGRAFLPEHFPTIEMDSFSVEVELLFRAPGFYRRRQRVSLHPGPNQVRVQLQPH